MSIKKYFIGISALAMATGQPAVAETKPSGPISKTTQSVIEPFNAPKGPTLDERYNDFHGRLNAAKSQIGPEKMAALRTFNKCVADSTQLYKDNNSVSGFYGISPEEAQDLKAIATAECAAKIYGGPSGMGGK